MASISRVQRIFGLEVEYTLRAMSTLAQKLLTEHLQALRPNAGGYLLNGGRLYMDGVLPEYATPECSSLRLLVAHDVMAERLMAELADAVSDMLSRDNPKGPRDVRLLKTNRDLRGHPVGTHENYCVPYAIEYQRVVRSLIPFLVTRQVIAGGGFTGWHAGRYLFAALSERAFSVTDPTWALGGVSLISARQAPRGEQFRRLHVVGGDSTRSESATLLKVGATDLVVRAIEAGVSFEDLALTKPVIDLRRISRDGPQELLRPADGRARTAAQLQADYVNRVAAYVDRGGLAAEPEVSRVLELWQRAVEAGLIGDPGLVCRDIDWAIKRTVPAEPALQDDIDEAFEREQQRYADGRSLLPAPPQREDVIDAMYAEVGPNSLYARLERMGRINHIVTSDDVDLAANQPPQNTRAKPRAQAVDWREAGVTVKKWDELAWTDPAGVPFRVDLPDPKQTDSHAMTWLHDRVRDAAKGVPVNPRAPRPTEVRLEQPHKPFGGPTPPAQRTPSLPARTERL